MRTYWHFCNLDSAGQPVMRDGTRVVVGERYEIEGRPKLCERGYHGSLRVIDALKYARGPWVSKRPLEGVIRGGDKVVGRAFVQQPGIDATDVLMDFARGCALDVVHLWDAPEIVVRYLETGDESIRDAALGVTRAASRAAALEPTWNAARHSSCIAAWVAAHREARNATWIAMRAWGQAEAAVLATTQDAVWGATRDAARAVQNRRLTRMLERALIRGNAE